MRLSNPQLIWYSENNWLLNPQSQNQLQPCKLCGRGKKDEEEEEGKKTATFTAPCNQF
jgi:hypothetical protein